MKASTGVALAVGILVVLTGAVALAVRKPKLLPAPIESNEDKGVRILKRCKEAVDTLNPQVIDSVAVEIEASAPDTGALMRRIATEIRAVNETSEYEAHKQAKEALFFTVAELRNLANNEMKGQQKTLTLAVADKLATLTR